MNQGRGRDQDEPRLAKVLSWFNTSPECECLVKEYQVPNWPVTVIVWSELSLVWCLVSRWPANSVQAAVETIIMLHCLLYNHGSWVVKINISFPCCWICWVKILCIDTHQRQPTMCTRGSAAFRLSLSSCGFQNTAPAPRIYPHYIRWNRASADV